MDDTLEEDAGFSFLQNGDEIPVHSTPIKGDKVPLPSTRHVAKFLHQRTRRRTNQDETDCESIQSVRSADAMETKGHRDGGHIDGGHRTDIEHRSDIQVLHKQLYPQPDRVLDISNQDNLRPKLRELYHHTDHLRYENDSLNQLERYEVDKHLVYSTRSSSLMHTITGHHDKEVSSNSQSKSSLHSLLTNENQNAFSSYKNSKKNDRALSVGEDNEVSYSVHISHTNSPRGTSVRDDVTTSPGRHTVQIETITKAGGMVDRIDSVTDRQPFTFNSSKFDSRYSKQNSSYKELENDTIARQRQEVQLLVSELKDRDRELSDTLASHQQQLLAWEQDRTRITSLEKKIHHIEDELQTKSSKLRNAILTLKAAKSRELESNIDFEKVRSAMDTLNAEKRKAESECEKCKVENNGLQKQIDTLSSRLGQLQTRESELNTNIKSKEKDISYATGQMKELSKRLQQLDLRCKASQDLEKEAFKERDHWKNRYEDSYNEIQKLTEELKSKTNQCSKVLEENWSARNQLSLVQKESGEREKCKDDVIESMRVKQERTDKQLKSLRELYEHQLYEMAQLQKQVDAFRDIMEKQPRSMEQIHLSQSDRSSVFTPDSSHSKQHLNSSQSRPSQTHKGRESDLSHFTQSSGYQSQLSVNQTGINTGSSQFVPSGITSDARYNQSVHAVSSERSEVTENHTKVGGTGSKSQRSVDMYSEADQSSSCNDTHDKGSPLREKMRRRSLSPHKQKKAASTSASTSGKIRRNSIKLYGQTESDSPPEKNRKSYARSHNPNSSTEKSRRNSYSPNKHNRSVSPTHKAIRNGARLQDQNDIDNDRGNRETFYPNEACSPTERSRRKSVRPHDQNEINTSTERSRRNSVRSPDLNEANTSTGKNRRNSVKPLDSNEADLSIERTRRNSVMPHSQNEADSSTERMKKNLVRQQDWDESDYSSGKGKSSVEPDNQQLADPSTGSPSSTQRVVIKHTTISMYPNDIESSDSRDPSVKGGEEAEGGSLLGAYSDIEREFVFENKLRSFLDDIDADYDDSIWEEKPEQTQSISGVNTHSISGVDCSPSSKLAKLLLESRMMIDSLEKSTDKPFKHYTAANDTLEKPHLEDTSDGTAL